MVTLNHAIAFAMGTVPGGLRRLTVLDGDGAGRKSPARRGARPPDGDGRNRDGAIAHYLAGRRPHGHVPERITSTRKPRGVGGELGVEVGDRRQETGDRRQKTEYR